MAFECEAAEKFVADIMACIDEPEERNPYWRAAHSIESEFRKAVARIRELEAARLLLIARDECGERNFCGSETVDYHNYISDWLSKYGSKAVEKGA